MYPPLRLLIFLSLLLSGTAGAAGDDWMKELPDAARLSQLSIPGTHDSGALFEPFPGTAKCQSLTIPEQLAAGVRFLDIRCRHLRDGFVIHHGPIYQNLDFDGALAAVRSFLAAHPSESVILSIKEESNPEGNTRTFEQTFDAYRAKEPQAWFTGSGIPTLAEVRGKMVLFRRFGSKSPKGIPATPWPDNSTFSSGFLRVQDRYQIPDVEAKWQAFENLLHEANAGDSNTWFVNFSSATGGQLGIPNIQAMADGMNRNIATYFTAHPSGHHGIIVMDFADAGRCALIYGSNLPATKAP